MDSRKATERLEEVQNELQCSICQDYFVQATTLSCSHSFCLKCINLWKQTHNDCPVCRRKILVMAPSRALDNMVAAFVSRKNSGTTLQADLQQSTSSNPATSQQNQEQFNDFNYDDGSYYDSDDDYSEGGEEEEYSNSDGIYDGEEENDEDEDEEDENEDEECQEEEEEDDEDNANSNVDSEDVEYSDSDYDEQHAKWSNQNNPNNDEYWKLRGWPGRPHNWKELIRRK